MNTERIHELTVSLNSIESAKFYCTNWALISFKSDFLGLSGTHHIRPSHEDKTGKMAHKMMKELNEVIKPVLKIWAEQIREELRKEVER